MNQPEGFSLGGLFKTIYACGKVVFEKALQGGILLDGDSESSQSESSYLCKSDCSHCEALQLKENASILINQQSLDYYESSSASKLRPNVQILGESFGNNNRQQNRYFIAKDDKNYDRLNKQIKLLNETSLNLDNCEGLSQEERISIS